MTPREHFVLVKVECHQALGLLFTAIAQKSSHVEVHLEVGREDRIVHKHERYLQHQKRKRAQAEEESKGEKESEGEKESKGEQQRKGQAIQPNILILEIDSVSRSYAQRHLPQTFALLQKLKQQSFVPASPTPPTPPTPPPTPSDVKPCKGCRGGACRCAWASQSACYSGDGSCCHTCCCGQEQQRETQNDRQQHVVADFELFNSVGAASLVNSIAFLSGCVGAFTGVTSASTSTPAEPIPPETLRSWGLQPLKHSQDTNRRNLPVRQWCPNEAVASNDGCPPGFRPGAGRENVERSTGFQGTGWQKVPFRRGVNGQKQTGFVCPKSTSCYNERSQFCEKLTEQRGAPWLFEVAQNHGMVTWFGEEFCSGGSDFVFQVSVAISAILKKKYIYIYIYIYIWI
jgi:hypothetical protein